MNFSDPVPKATLTPTQQQWLDQAALVCAVQGDALYKQLNDFRDWTAANISNYEVMLEDEWHDNGTTTIGYYLRSKTTFNIELVAEDIYASHQDSKGVWHLGDYQNTVWLINKPFNQQLALFITANTPVT